MKGENELCIYCGNKEAIHKHHLFPRGSHPELKDEYKNIINLCAECHNKSHNDPDFLHGLQEVYYNWKPANLDLFLRAEHNIEMLEKGQVAVENLSPALSDNYLQLAGAMYSQMSDELSQIECKYPKWLTENAGEKSMKRIEIEWQGTEWGHRMIYLKRKLRSLEKLMSNLRARLDRQGREWYLAKKQ